MTDKILVVFEGERTEPNIFNSIARIFFPAATAKVLYGYFRADIYQLWQAMVDDTDLDLFELLREKDRGLFPGILRRDISQVYLFFDHDAHSRRNVRETFFPMRELLTFFDNETEHGKLYVSYPMVEAVKDCKRGGSLCLSRCSASVSANTSYKALVNSRTDFADMRKLSEADWQYIEPVPKQPFLIYLDNAYSQRKPVLSEGMNVQQ